jgi:multiple sugar transport system ATP-binding protein
MAIELKNIRKVFGEVEVIKPLSLEIKEGDFVVLVGPSGCGKSTLLRMIAGLEEVSEGQVSLFGQDHTHSAPGARNVAMVFQDYALYPHMTVAENLAFGLRMKKTPETDIQKRLTETAAMLDLTDYLERKPQALSGGQRQRVAMGRAVMKRSSLFLYDEPLSNLDAKLRTKMRSEIKRFHVKQKTTSLYVTHDQLEAMTLADQLVVLKDGRIEQQGSPLEVFENPYSVFVATFIGTPGMNILPSNVEWVGHECFVIPKGQTHRLSMPEEKAALLKDRKEVLLGIRPSDVYLATTDSSYSQWQFQAELEFTEMLGKNAYLHLNIGSGELIGEIMGREMPKRGVVPVEMNLYHAQLFDPKTEINLSRHP